MDAGTVSQLLRTRALKEVELQWFIKRDELEAAVDLLMVNNRY